MPDKAKRITQERLDSIKLTRKIERGFNWGDLDALFDHIDFLQSTINQQRAEIETARRERDEALGAVLEMQEMEAQGVRLRHQADQRLLDAITLCEGERVSERFVRWPCWNPQGDVSIEASEARLAFSLAKAIAALIENEKERT